MNKLDAKDLTLALYLISIGEEEGARIHLDMVKDKEKAKEAVEKLAEIIG